MRYAIRREPITPQRPMRMAGYRCRTRPFESVLDPLYATALLLDDSRRMLLLISLDVCMVDREFTREMKMLLHQACGLDEDYILLHAIHTHAGPVTMLSDTVADTADRRDVEAYRRTLRDAIIRCVQGCLSSLREGSLHMGLGETFIGMHRRQHTSDGVRIGPNPNQSVSRLAQALTLRNSRGVLEGIVFSCACHPVVLYPRNTHISADYPGAARTELEGRHPDAIAMFLQGPGADINPAVLTADDQYRDTYYSDVLFTGRILANDIQNILLRDMEEVALCINARSADLSLPLSGQPKTAFTLDDPSLAQGQLQATAIRLSRRLLLLGLDAEITDGIGRSLRERLGDSSLILGLVNGWMGYFPTAQILEEGGYEAVCSSFGRPYSSQAPQILEDRLADLAGD